MSSISPEQLRSSLNVREAPLLIDVRRRDDYLDSAETISGALRRDPEAVASWAGELPAADPVVVFCAHGGEVSQRVAGDLQARGNKASYLEGGFERWRKEQGPLDRKPVGASTRWVTRERPKIDRIACPWLVRRFVDRDAELIYVPTAQVIATADARDAVPYDIPSVHFSHEGERCSFDAFVQHYRLRDPALQQLAVIVRGADTARLDLAPQAAGLAAISLGLSRTFADDHEMLRHGVVMYDALYAWCKEGRDALHTWNPKSCA